MRIEESRLVLELGEPGMDNSQKIVSLLDASTIVPLHIVRVDLQDKAKETLEAFRGDVRRLTDRPRMDRIPASAFEVTVTGDARISSRNLKPSSRQGRNSKAVLRFVETLQFLAEPVVVFSLRDDVRWHDGEPFTSRDVAFTYRAIMDDARRLPAQTGLSLHSAYRNAGRPHGPRHLPKAILPCPEQLDDWDATRSHSRRQTARNGGR